MSVKLLDEDGRRDLGIGRCWMLLPWLAVVPLGMIVLFGSAMADQWGQLLAQSGPPGNEISDPSGNGGWLGLDGWITKVAIIPVVFVTALLFFFCVMFPWLLRKSRPWWPRSAYGFCMSLVLSVSFGTALLLLWDDLVIGNNVSPGSWWRVWGGRAAVTLIWLIVVSAVLMAFRSPRGRRSF